MSQKAGAPSGYPNPSFGKNLGMIAGLIASGCDTQVYYVSLTGFDTHARQKQIQERLLETLSESLSTFAADLKKSGHFNDTLVMTFSEFGRRVKENGSAGTDHGSANNMILMSGSLSKKGFYNEGPDLSNLVSGDLAYKIDFRDIYGTIIKKWLNNNPEKILKTATSEMNFI